MGPIIIALDEVYSHLQKLKPLTCIISFNCHNNPLEWVLILTHFRVEENEAQERLNNLPEMTELVTARPRYARVYTMLPIVSSRRKF